jgi:hypothetical protein
MTEIQSYEEVLQTLSEGSVRLSFDAFRDIDWDNPANAIDPDADCWILPAVHPLGGHSWYQELPAERQKEIGLWMMAQMMKVGLEFENLLIRGLMQFVYDLPNGSPEFRYVTHEATEETHHTQMFQEFVNRTGIDAPGMRGWTKTTPLQLLIPAFARIFPAGFFTMVLGGEEPIDHAQKMILRSDWDMHPLVRRITSIHVAEEARHISFAHRFLTENAGQLNWFSKGFLGIATPLVYRLMCDMILTPDRASCAKLGIPREVAKEVYWQNPQGRELLSETFADLRMLAEEMGLRGRVTRPLWKVLGMGGRPARFRGEVHERGGHGRRAAATEAA